MDQDGRQVVFQSQADLLGTGSTGWEIFLLDRQTGVLRQLTNGTGDSTDASMGGGGRFVLFLSTSDFSGSGIAGGPHLFIYDLIEDALYQATRPGPGTSGTADRHRRHDLLLRLRRGPPRERDHRPSDLRTERVPAGAAARDRRRRR